MSILLDIGFLALFVLTVVLAAKRGFFATLMSLAAYVVSLLGAKLLSTALAPQIFERYFADEMRREVIERLDGVRAADYVAQFEKAIQAIPDYVNGMMQLLGIQKEDVIQKLQTSPLRKKDMVENVMANFVSPVTTAVIRTLLFVVIAFLLSIVLRFVAEGLNRVIKGLPAIKQINTSLGVVIGVIRGAIIVLLLALCLSVISGFVDNPKLLDAVQHSHVEIAARGFLNSISGYAASKL